MMLYFLCKQVIKIKTNIKINKQIFNKTYLPHLFDYSHKIEVYYGGSGSGKSHFVAMKVLIKALNNKRKILVLRRVSATLKDSVWQLMLDCISTLKIYDDCKINKSEMKIELPNGSLFLFKGIDDGGEKIKSITGLTDCWIEEATEFDLDSFTQIKLRIRAKTKNNQIILSYNPINKQNYVYDLFHNPDTRDNNVMVLKTTYLDNKFLPSDYIEEIESLKNSNPYYYQVYALGEFGTLDKTVFTNWKTANLDVNELLKIDNIQLCSGIDVGFTHQYAVCISLVNEATKTIYVIDEMSKSKIINKDAYDWIVKKGYASNLFICDEAAPSAIKEFKMLGLNVEKTNKRKETVFSQLMAMQAYKIIISDNCVNFINEIMAYSWKKDKQGNYTDEIVKFNDDLMDAFRYSLANVLKIKNKKEPEIITVRL